MNKQKILDVSFDLISDNGLENFTMRKLSQTLGVQAPTIYYYYKSKDDILNAVFLDTISLFFDDEDYDDLEEFFYNYGKSVQENRRRYLFMLKSLKASFLNDENKEKLKEYKEGIERFFIKYRKSSNVNRILTMGPFIEIAIFDQINLNDDELRLIAKKICFMLKEDFDETTIYSNKKI